MIEGLQGKELLSVFVNSSKSMKEILTFMSEHVDDKS
jgi:hypothetical protein